VYSQKKDLNVEAGALKLVSSAIEIQEEPGVPFYFKCDAKQYMAIMKQVNNVKNRMKSMK
jgi:hypothetical protein